MCKDGKTINFSEEVKKNSEKIELSIKGASKEIQRLNKYFNGETELLDRYSDMWQNRLQAKKDEIQKLKDDLRVKEENGRAELAEQRQEQMREIREKGLQK